MRLLLLEATLGCWYVFAAVWLIAAFSTKKTVEKKSLASRLAYSIPIALGAILLFSPPKGIPLFERTLFEATVGWRAAGLLVTLSGLCLALWARMTLGRNWSGTVTFKENHELVQTGPYAFVRHPIYTAIILMFLGTALGVGRLGGFVGVPLVFISCWIKLSQEEALMRTHFPEYSEYMSRVRALIPGLL